MTPIQQHLLGLGGAKKVGWIMKLDHDGNSAADWKQYTQGTTSYNTQSKNCYKGVTGDDSTGIWFWLGSHASGLSGSTARQNHCCNVFKIDADGGITAKCTMGADDGSNEGSLFLNDQEDFIIQQNYKAHCISLSGTTFTHQWTLKNGNNEQGHSNAPYNYYGDGWTNESVGMKPHQKAWWLWAATDKLWYFSDFKEQHDGGGGTYYGNLGPTPINVSTGAMDHNYPGSGNNITNYYGSDSHTCVQVVNSRCYFVLNQYYTYQGGGGGFRGSGIMRWDTDCTSIANAFQGSHSGSNHNFDRILTYSPGTSDYTRSTYNYNYLHMWVHDTGSSEKLYLGGSKYEYSNENSSSYAGNLPTEERNFVGKLGNDDDQFDWCSNLDGGSSSAGMDSDYGFSNQTMGGVLSVRPDGNGNCISVHAAHNHVVSGKNEIIIAKWNDTTGALISTYGISCITTNYNWHAIPMGYQKGCLTTADAVYIVVWTESNNTNNYRGTPIIMKLPHDIGSLAGNHTVGGLTFTIGAATGVTQGRLTKNRIGFDEEGSIPYFWDNNDRSRDVLQTTNLTCQSNKPDTTINLADLK